MFNPALHKYPNETALIGQLVVGYPELDIQLCMVCGLAMANRQIFLEALHKIESESVRIEVANALCRKVFIDKGLEAQFGEAIGAMRYCRKIRNQYSHTQFADLNNLLCFTQADKVNWIAGTTITFHATSLDVLQAQESYFEYTRKCLITLGSVDI